MKIAIIGGSGFVGTSLINKLKEDNNYHVKNLDIVQSKKYPEITSITDIRDYGALTKSLAGYDCIVLLAAQHRDDVSPISLYYDTNVKGMENTLKAMEDNSIKRLIFYSSVSIYGLNTKNPNEDTVPLPFNHYGKSKLVAETILNKWKDENPDIKITIIRPCVIFGEGNRGNVYNLLAQIESGRFLMVGSGENKKSMAYIENITGFTKYILEKQQSNYEVYNYVDKPDLSMNELIRIVNQSLGRKSSHIKIPYSIGLLGAYCFDILAKILRRKFVVSSIRVKKFCANSQISSEKMLATGFTPTYTIEEALKRTMDYEWPGEVHTK